VTRLLLVRHAESEWNAQGRWQGLADPGLSEQGRKDAKKAAARLDGSVERIVSSDLQRAALTAEIFADVLQLGPVDRVSGLREIDVGEWSGLTRSEIDIRWPGGIERWRRGENVGNGAEDRDAFRERVVATVTELGDQDRGPILVVTHGGVISAVEWHLDVHPGSPLPRLSGRWFDYDGVLRAVGERFTLLEER
jgi:broad specificity phosphatase PhoE